jgi:hypothetical protein
MPEEEAAFLDFLESTGVVVAYPDHWARAEAEASARPLRAYLAESNPGQVLLGLETGKADVVIGTKTKEEDQFYHVELMSSCLIGYRRPRFGNDNLIEQSALAAYLDFFKDHARRAKPEWFRAWVRRVFGWAKRHANQKCVHQGFSYPATPLVRKLVEENVIEIRL